MENKKFLIDTCLIIDYLRKKDKKSTLLFELVQNNQLYLSAISYFELFIGASNQSKKNDILLLLDYLYILPFNEVTADKASWLHLSLKKRNQLIDIKDLFIASTALVNYLPIVTFNKSHFERIEGLEVI